MCGGRVRTYPCKGLRRVRLETLLLLLLLLLWFLLLLTAVTDPWST